MKTQKLVFNHSKYKHFANKYIISNTGRVYKKNGEELKYFTKINNNTPFVRLFQFGKDISICVGKLVLLTFNPRGFRENKIAIHLDGLNTNNHINNLTWGTRQEQSIIHMQNPKNFKRISKMGKKYGKANGKINGKKYGKNNLIKYLNLNSKIFSPKTISKIKVLLQKGKTPTEISRKLNIGRSSIYRYI